MRRDHIARRVSDRACACTRLGAGRGRYRTIEDRPHFDFYAAIHGGIEYRTIEDRPHLRAVRFRCRSWHRRCNGIEHDLSASEPPATLASFQGSPSWGALRALSRAAEGRARLGKARHDRECAGVCRSRGSAGAHPGPCLRVLRDRGRAARDPVGTRCPSARSRGGLGALADGAGTRPLGGDATSRPAGSEGAGGACSTASRELRIAVSVRATPAGLSVGRRESGRGSGGRGRARSLDSDGERHQRHGGGRRAAGRERPELRPRSGR